MQLYMRDLDPYTKLRGCFNIVVLDTVASLPESLSWLDCRLEWTPSYTYFKI